MFDNFVGTRTVASSQMIDVLALQDYLRNYVDGFTGKVKIEQFNGGQSNPTFKLEVDGHQFVLRTKPGPAAKLLPSAHAIDREFRVMDALYHAGIPVPRQFHLCVDESVIGRAFYLMEFVPGRVLWDPAMPGMDMASRAAHYDEMNRVIAQLHKVDYVHAGLESYGKPGNYFTRQIARWTKQYRASETRAIPAMEELIQWLPQHIPNGDDTSVVHGDYRLDNLIFDAQEPRIVAVLDWELSTIGHPMADFFYHCLAWHLPSGTLRGTADLDGKTLGIPNVEDYMESYCRRTDRFVSQQDVNFYLAYNLFRMAAIYQGIMKRHVEGTASSKLALKAGESAEPVAKIGWQFASRN